MKLRRGIALLLLCIGTGCTFDLTEVEPEPAVDYSQPGFFTFGIDATPNQPFRLVGSFFPGVLTDGSPQPVADPSVRINDITYSPMSAFEGAYVYQFGSRNPFSAGPLRVQPPQLAGFDPVDPLVVHVPGIAPVDSIVTSRVDGVTIGMTGVPPTDTMQWNWSIALRPDDSADAILIAHTGRYPAIVRFPAELIPASMQRGVITINMFSYAHFPLEGRSFSINVRRQFTADIPLRIANEIEQTGHPTQ